MILGCAQTPDLLLFHVWLFIKNALAQDLFWIPICAAIQSSNRMCPASHRLETNPKLFYPLLLRTADLRTHTFIHIHTVDPYNWVAALWSPEGKGLASWLLFVMFIVILLLSHLVSCDRCGTWLYQLLILAVFLTSNNVVYAISKASDQPVHMRSLIRAFACCLTFLWLLSYWLNTI